MNGWLVYSPAGVTRNRWFVDRILAGADARGIALKLKIVPETGELPPELLGELRDSPPDFAMVRVIRPDFSERMESAGVRTVNNALTSRVANDKWRTFEISRELGLPVMATFRFTLPDLPACGFPCVVKSLDGHGGSEVTLVDDAKHLVRFAASCGKRDFIAQRLCSDPGRDIRVYALGGEIVGAVLRTSQTDFRSNFSLGGEVKAVETTHNLRQMVRTLYDRLGFDFVGVDFIRHEGHWLLNEIEDVVGCRMLYATTHEDIVPRYLARAAGLSWAVASADRHWGK